MEDDKTLAEMLHGYSKRLRDAHSDMLFDHELDVEQFDPLAEQEFLQALALLDAAQRGMKKAHIIQKGTEQ